MFFFGSITVGSYLLYHLVRQWCKQRSSWVTSRTSWKRIARWFTGIGFQATEFRPLAPAGSGRVTWTTTGGQLEWYEDGKCHTTDPIEPVCGRFFVDGIFPWRITADRHGDDVTYQFQPVLWAERQVPTISNTCLAEHVVRREVTKDGVVVNVCRQGLFESCELNATEEAVLYSNLKVHGQRTQPYSIGVVLRSIDPNRWKENNAAKHMRMLADLWCTEWATLGTSQTRPRQALEFVSDVRADLEAEAECSGWKVGPELALNSDVAPMMGHNNDLVAIDERLDKVRNVNFTASEELRQYSEEFINLISPWSADLEPWPLDRVLEHQSRPIQRARNERDKNFLGLIPVPVRIKAMLKKEALAHDGAVRNISTYNTDHNLTMSTYTLAISEYLKRYPWYGPGQTPRGIAERLVMMATHSKCLVEADYDKMDARKTVALVYCLHIPLARRLFNDPEDFITMRVRSLKSTAKTDGGVDYANGESQGSGEATTTVDNTVTNAFVSYCAYRLEGFTNLSAWEQLQANSTFTGDDSVTTNDPDCLVRAGSMAGHVIKVDVRSYTEPVSYLSRKFPDLWFGGDGSYQDIDRLLRKCHMSFGDPSRSIQQLAADKWAGYHGLDPAMGVYRAFKECVERVTGLVGGIDWQDQPWVLREHPGESWPQVDNPDRYLEQVTGVPAGAYIEWARSCTTWDDWLQGPGFVYENDNKHKVKLIVDPTDNFSGLPPLVDNPVSSSVTTGSEGAVNRRRVEVWVNRQVRQEQRLLSRRAAKRRTKHPEVMTIGNWSDVAFTEDSVAGLPGYLDFQTGSTPPLTPGPDPSGT